MGEEAGKLYYRLLVDHKRENWSYIQSYIDCQCKGEPINPEIVSNVRELLQTMEDNSNPSIPLRNIHLGRVQVLFLLYKANGSEETADELFNSLKLYLKTFGHKLVCFRDMQLFLPDLPIEKVKELCTSYEASVNQEIKESEQLTVATVSRRSTLEQLKTKYGFYSNLSGEQTKQTVEEYLSFYHRALQIPSASKLVETERQYADDLIVLAAHLYIDLYLRDGNPEDLVRSLAICTLGLEHSKFNAIRVNCLLGALQPASTLYTSLETKHIQIDTLSHLLLSDAISLRITDCYESLLFAMSRFYSDSLLEMPELVTQPYSKESYTRAREFREFHEKITNSVQRSIHNIEFTIGEFLGKANAADALEEINYAESKIHYEDKSFAELYETADNSCWDNWHTIPSLSSPYVTNSATTLLSNEDRLVLTQVRGAAVHLTKAILENEPEDSQKYFAILQTGFEKVSSSFDETTKPIWDLWFLAFRYFTNIQTVVSFLKGTKVDDAVSKQAFEDLGNLRKQITDTKEKLDSLTQQEGKFVGRSLPLHTFYSTNLCWIRLLLLAVSPLVPKRLKKNASAAVKDIHKKLRADFRTFGSFVNEQLEAATSVYTEFSTSEATLGDISVCEGVPAEILASACESVAQSYKDSFADLVKRVAPL